MEVATCAGQMYFILKVYDIMIYICITVDFDTINMTIKAKKKTIFIYNNDHMTI